LRRSGRKLADTIRDCPIFPQVLINVRVSSGFKLNGQPEIAGVVTAVEDELGDSGRVVLRPSGTEPLVRVMVEGRDEAQVNLCAERIAEVVRRVAGA
jgi:phosphoglucosamine mutase